MSLYDFTYTPEGLMFPKPELMTILSPFVVEEARSWLESKGYEWVERPVDPQFVAKMESRQRYITRRIIDFCAIGGTDYDYYLTLRNLQTYMDMYTVENCPISEKSIVILGDQQGKRTEPEREKEKDRILTEKKLAIEFCRYLLEKASERIGYVDVVSQHRPYDATKYGMYMINMPMRPYDYQVHFLNTILADMERTKHIDRLEITSKEEQSLVLYDVDVYCASYDVKKPDLKEWREYMEVIGLKGAALVKAFMTLESDFKASRMRNHLDLPVLALIALFHNRGNSTPVKGSYDDMQSLRALLEDTTDLDRDMAFMDRLKTIVIDNNVVVNQGPCSFYYMNSMAGAGKTSAAIMAAKLIELFKRTHKPKRHFEMVFGTDMPAIARQVYEEAKRAGVAVSLLYEDNSSYKIESNQMDGYETPGIRWNGRDMIIMPTFLISPYINGRRADVTDIGDPRSRIGNGHAYVCIDELSGRIGDLTASSPNPEMDILQLTRAFGSDICTMQNAPPVIATFGATMPDAVEVENSINIVNSRNMTTRLEDSGKCHVGAELYLPNGASMTPMCMSIDMALQGLSLMERAIYVRFFGPAFVQKTIHLIRTKLEACTRYIDIYERIVRNREEPSGMVEKCLACMAGDHRYMAEYYEVVALYPDLDYIRLKPLVRVLKTQLPPEGHAIAEFGLHLMRCIYLLGIRFCGIRSNNAAETFEVLNYNTTYRLPRAEFSWENAIIASREYFETFGFTDTVPVQRHRLVDTLKVVSSLEGAKTIAFTVNPIKLAFIMYDDVDSTLEGKIRILSESIVENNKKRDKIMTRYRDMAASGLLDKTAQDRYRTELDKIPDYRHLSDLSDVEQYFYIKERVLIMTASDTSHTLGIKLSLAKGVKLILADRVAAYGLNLVGVTRCFIMPDFAIHHSSHTIHQALARTGRKGLSDESKWYMNCITYYKLGDKMFLDNSHHFGYMYQASLQTDVRQEYGRISNDGWYNAFVKMCIDAVKGLFDTELPYLSSICPDMFTPDMELSNFSARVWLSFARTNDNSTYRFYSEQLYAMQVGNSTLGDSVIKGLQGPILHLSLNEREERIHLSKKEKRDLKESTRVANEKYSTKDQTKERAAERRDKS